MNTGLGYVFVVLALLLWAGNAVIGRVRDEFFKMYARAREARADLHAAQVLEIADTTVGTMVEVAHAKNKMDARKWLTSKMYPRVYGDHVEHQHVGDFQPAILIQVSGSFLPQYQEKKLVAFGLKPDWNPYITGGEPAAALALRT